MKSTLAGLIIVFAVLTALASETNLFKVITSETKCPEYGTPVLQHLLLVDTNRVCFSPPQNWRISTDADKQSVSFVSPDLSATLTLRVLLNGFANGRMISDSGAVEEMKRLILPRFPQATMAAAENFFGGGMRGEVIGYRFGDPQGRQMHGRLGVLNVPGGGKLEIGYVGIRDWTTYQIEFLRFMNSLRVERGLPAAAH
jgi:hypothetical protein